MPESCWMLLWLLHIEERLQKYRKDAESRRLSPKERGRV